MWPGFLSMGHYLYNTYGELYYAVGFEFEKGSFRAKVLQQDSTYQIQEVYIEKNNGLLWPDMLSKGKKQQMYFLDFKKGSSIKSLKGLLNRDVNFHEIGSVFSKNGSSPRMIPVESYDGVVFVKNSTPTEGTK